MKKIFTKENLQKFLFVGVVVLVFGVFMLSLVLGNSNETPSDKNDNNNNVEEPNNNNNNNNNTQKPGNQDNQIVPEKPEEKFKKPCQETSVIVRYFYNVDDDKETQEMSLIQFGSKYYMSRGVTYNSNDEQSFEVYAPLSGKVTSVTESSVYGVCVTVSHSNGLVTEYVGLSEAKVNQHDVIEQGTVIGISGEAEYDVDAKNHVHFRVILNDRYIDPLSLYDLAVSEIK